MAVKKGTNATWTLLNSFQEANRIVAELLVVSLGTQKKTGRRVYIATAKKGIQQASSDGQASVMSNSRMVTVLRWLRTAFYSTLGDMYCLADKEEEHVRTDLCYWT